MRITRLGKQSNSAGFTIVELLIVIVVIAILATIAIIAYNGIQGRAIETTLASTLHNAGTAMGISNAENGEYPTTLPESIKSTEKVQISLVPQGGTAVYTSLSATQNALLLLNTCQDLINQGVGAKPDDNHHYISECRVYNNGALNLNGWNGRDINTPITSASLSTYVNSYSGGSISEFRSHAQDFMDQLMSKFQAAGGTFPVTQFWDSWATSTNGGIMQPTLPEPTTTGATDSTKYCIQATYIPQTEHVKHITQNSAITDGAC